MTYNIYCIKDKKGCFMQPFIQLNEAIAIREFGNLVNLGSSVVSQNYSDMDLYFLGTFNMDTGSIVPEVKFIISGSSVYTSDCEVV